MDLHAYQYRIELFSPATNETLAVIFTSDKGFAYGFTFSVQTRLIITEFENGKVKGQLQVVSDALPSMKRKFLTEFLGINPFKER